MADQLQISQQSLSNYETGRVRVPDEVAADIAQLWGLRESEVWKRLGRRVPDDEGGAELVELPVEENVLRLPPGVQLTQKQQRALDALLDAFLDDLERESGRD